MSNKGNAILNGVAAVLCLICALYLADKEVESTRVFTILAVLYTFGCGIYLMDHMYED